MANAASPENSRTDREGDHRQYVITGFRSTGGCGLQNVRCAYRRGRALCSSLRNALFRLLSGRDRVGAGFTDICQTSGRALCSPAHSPRPAAIPLFRQGERRAVHDGVFDAAYDCGLGAGSSTAARMAAVFSALPLQASMPPLLHFSRKLRVRPLPRGRLCIIIIVTAPGAEALDIEMRFFICPSN